MMTIADPSAQTEIHSDVDSESLNSNESDRDEIIMAIKSTLSSANATSFKVKSEPVASSPLPDTPMEIDEASNAPLSNTIASVTCSLISKHPNSPLSLLQITESFPNICIEHECQNSNPSKEMTKSGEFDVAGSFSSKFNEIVSDMDEGVATKSEEKIVPEEKRDIPSIQIKLPYSQHMPTPENSTQGSDDSIGQCGSTQGENDEMSKDENDDEIVTDDEPMDDEEKEYFQPIAMRVTVEKLDSWKAEADFIMSDMKATKSLIPITTDIIIRAAAKIRCRTENENMDLSDDEISPSDGDVIDPDDEVLYVKRDESAEFKLRAREKRREELHIRRKRAQRVYEEKSKELDQEEMLFNQGTHPDFVREMALLEESNTNRLAECKNRYQELLASIERDFEMDVASAKGAYKREFDKIKSNFTSFLVSQKYTILHKSRSLSSKSSDLLPQTPVSIYTPTDLREFRSHELNLTRQSKTYLSNKRMPCWTKELCTKKRKLGYKNFMVPDFCTELEEREAKADLISLGISL